MGHLACMRTSPFDVTFLRWCSHWKLLQSSSKDTNMALLFTFFKTLARWLDLNFHFVFVVLCSLMLLRWNWLSTLKIKGKYMSINRWLWLDMCKRQKNHFLEPKESFSHNSLQDNCHHDHLWTLRVHNCPNKVYGICSRSDSQWIRKSCQANKYSFRSNCQLLSNIRYRRDHRMCKSTRSPCRIKTWNQLKNHCERHCRNSNYQAMCTSCLRKKKLLKLLSHM